MEKNDDIKVVIDDIGSSGEGIAHVDGVTVFVPFALKGEICTVHILKVKDSIAWAKLLEVIEPSKTRIDPKCKYYKICGGCTLEHTNSQSELEIKKQKIQTAFKKNANQDIEDIEMFDSDKIYAYRNKCAFPVRNINGQNVVCMFKHNSHTPIAIDRCELADENINIIVNLFNEFLKDENILAYDEKLGKGTVKFLVVRVVNSIPLITIVINDKNLKSAIKFANRLKQYFPKFGLNLNINKQNNNVILTPNFIYICGEEELQTSEMGIIYPVASLSFLQINDFVKNLIYEKVLSFIGESDFVIDAYSGAGLLSAILAKKAQYVYGIEIVGDATKNADSLVEFNKIDNLTNINGDCSVELPKLIESLKSKHVKVVLDPPRKGCDKKVIESIINAGIETVIYISCNPATLARDAKLLIDVGYEIERVEGFNMFPQTEHVETLAIFKKGAKNEN